MGLKKKTARAVSALTAAMLLTAAVPCSGLVSIAAGDYIFEDTFESGADSWKGRSATVSTSGDAHFDGGKSLYVQDRSDSWNGATKELGSSFKAGEEYSFSVNVYYTSGPATRDFKFTLQYTSGGDTTWDEIASGTVDAGQWLQLANTNYKLPSGGSDFMLIVETTDNTLQDFYMDGAIAAPAGTKIEGAGQPSPRVLIPGDVNFDGEINVFDVIAVRKGVLKGISDTMAKKAADVDGNRKVEAADLVQLQEYVLGKITEFTKDTSSSNGQLLTISEYTPICEAKLSMTDTNESHQKKNGVDYGKLEKKTYYSNFCKRNKSYNVLLPPGYSKDKEYPVMYVLHGYYENIDRMITTGNGTMYTQQILGNAIAAGEAKEMIVVFPHVYSSSTQDDVSGMDDANNRAYDNFDTVLTTEVMQEIEKNYSIATGRENTAITGFSMGGRESLQIGMNHPDLFGYVGAICPAPGATGSWKFPSEEESPSLVYITAGGQDDVVYTTPEGYHDNFTKNGVPHIYHYYPNGHHGDDSIHAHLYNFFRYAFNAYAD